MLTEIATLTHKLRAALSYKATETAVWDMLQALFHAEYLLIAEYIDCALPLLYALYLLALSQLPVARYYAQTAVPFNKLKFGISPLYQLAFVLETHVRTVQGHLIVWTVYILRMPLKHNGVASDIHLQ
ncbi:hypothetical protein PHYSODRAFT_311395 [Phytophthora sojae]|uniref:Uncharacterized protein n=1 Tax=Phytophthora sojae (strain P6497) TaxID=1094619 RepID=G4YW08_PHYSP|nr:hypothetical protein PHYSODRAFT_311395 [Phytophthora sojae]EGZ24391.1 hypothetical protein PHYSODRAFT_311395 [Phytophthora sojae]|eukprot:XP_009519679.1 hypothetical protein PHYSODRAFT_311395 [Phytophthora sojae]